MRNKNNERENKNQQELTKRKTNSLRDSKSSNIKSTSKDSKNLIKNE